MFMLWRFADISFVALLVVIWFSYRLFCDDVREAPRRSTRLARYIGVVIYLMFSSALHSWFDGLIT